MKKTITPAQMKAKREKLGLTQRELAEKIGYDIETVAKMEQGNGTYKGMKFLPERVSILMDSL